MNEESVSVSCRLEPVACNAETATGGTKATLGKGLIKALAGSWKRLAQTWTNAIDALQRMVRVCDTTPVACNYPL